MSNNKNSGSFDISVVIPSYNRRKSISICIESIRNQTFPPREIIVVDDNSTDDTRDVVQGIRCPDLKYLRLKRNMGAQAARNLGIYESSGFWIAFQDSDDEWVPEKLETQVEALKTVKYDPFTVVHTDCWQYKRSSGEKRLISLPLINGKNIYKEILTSQGPMFPGILTSKLALKKIDYLDEKVPSYQEWDTAIRLAKHCRFIHIQKPLFFYHIHEDETISKNTRKSIEGYQYIVDKFRDEILFYCGRDVYNHHIVKNALRAMELGFFEDAESILDKCVGIRLGVMLLKALNKNRIQRAILKRIPRCFDLFYAVHNDLIRNLRGKR